MKHLSLLIKAVLFPVALMAQYVGIGTGSPLYKLDIRGGSINTDSVYRINGSTALSALGTSNTFVGIRSGYSLTTGSLNTGAGYNALYSNTTGNNNTAIGNDALSSNTSGDYNTASGVYALYSNTTGDYNTATGHYALFSNGSGYQNTAGGWGALFANTNGIYNTAEGYSALHDNTTGIANTALGYAALYRNVNGSDNVAIGRAALDNSISNSGNTAVGAYALRNTTGADENTALGYYAGYGFNNGYYNTFIGSHARANADGYYNSIAIGTSATVTAPVQVRIGASFITSIGGYQGWTTLSDGRYKLDVQENVKGLPFIMKLRPVTYHMDVPSISEKLNEGRGRKADEHTLRLIADKKKILCSGFIAQEVEQAALETGYDFSGVDKPKNENDFYGLRYAEFTVPLVKAVQEQQSLILQLQAEINALRRSIRELQQPGQFTKHSLTSNQ